MKVGRNILGRCVLNDVSSLNEEGEIKMLKTLQLNQWRESTDRRKAEGRYHDILFLFGQGNLILSVKVRREKSGNFENP